MEQPVQKERRRFPRYRCEGKAEIRVPEATAVIWGTVTDLSAGGCYVELASPLPIGHEAKFTLTVLEAAITVDGKVAVVHPMFGMGVQFTACPQQEFQKLQEILYQISGLVEPLPESEWAARPPAVAAPPPPAGSKPAPAAPSPGPPGPAPAFRISPQAACKILDQIVKHLAQKGVLSKADFMAIVGKK
jgi:hypothetical protein